MSKAAESLVAHHLFFCELKLDSRHSFPAYKYVGWTTAAKVVQLRTPLEQKNGL